MTILVDPMLVARMATGAPQFLEIPFRGRRSGAFPLTWGQTWVWRSVASRAPHYADQSGAFIIPVPDGCDTSTVADALTSMVGRHETFRTRYSIALDGTPQQIVLADGILRVEVRDCDAADAEAIAAGIEDEFIRLPFTLPELSLRAALVTSDGIPRFVVLCVFNIAMDCHGMAFVLDEFTSVLNGTADDGAVRGPDETMHPADRALEEQSAQGMQRSARGVRYWEQELSKFPDDPLPYTQQRPESPRYKTFAMRSAAVRLATLEIADELRVGPSSVILAMAASLLGKRSGTETFGIVTAASHRYDQESMRYPGALVQGVPAAADVSGGSPRELIGRIHRTAMLAALAGQCHPDHVNDMLRKTYGDTASHKLAFVVNLNLPAPGHMTKANGTRATRADAERLLDESRYEFVEGSPVENEKLYLAAHGDTTNFHLTLRADTLVLTSADIVQFLRDLERSLLDCLPLDRKALPGIGVAAEADAYVAPGSDLEARVARIWADVLGTERPPGVEDNFFRTGGHSLNAMLVANRIHTELGAELSLRDIMERPTIRQLAELIARGEPSPLPAQAELIVQSPARGSSVLGDHPLGRFPLSPQQRQLWFLHELHGASSEYNVSLAFDVCGAIDLEAMEAAVDHVMSRHDVLRTTFQSTDAGPVQVIHDHIGGTFSHVDLRRLPAVSRRQTALEMARQEAERPFDLEGGPLVRLLLLRLADDRAILVLGTHHIVSDGWSMSVFVAEFNARYADYASGLRPVFRPRGAQYSDYVSWREQVSVQKSLEFWGRRLAGAPPLVDLSTDRPRPDVPSRRGGLVRFDVEPTLAQRIRAFNAENGVTQYVTLLAAFVALLNRYTRQEDVVIGSPVANREQRAFHDTIGYFVNTLPMRIGVEDGETFSDLVGRTKESVLDALEHQVVSLEEIVSETRPDRHLGSNPLFQIMFAVQNHPDVELEMNGLELEPVSFEHTVSPFDLTLTLGDEGRGLEGSIVYAADLFDESTAERIATHYLALLDALVSAPSKPIAEQSFLSADEREDVLALGLGETRALPSGSLAAIFESVVTNEPDAIAVVCGGAGDERSLTYRELNQRANQLARYLLAVAPPRTRLERIGIAMERSIDSLVSILAVIKTGAAYVPMDSESPASYVRFVVEDTDLDLIVTHSAQTIELGGRRCIDLSASATAIAELPHDNLPEASRQDDPAYIMYTSGSTGRPKGVRVLQRGVVRLVCNTDYLPSESGLRFTHLSPTTFDASTFEIWGCLLNGATMVLVEGKRPSLDIVADAIERHRADVVWLTTGLFKLMVEHRLGALENVRYLATGGDVAPLPQFKKVLAALPDCTLVNCYGPTENTTFSTTYRVPADEPCSLPLPIGRPISNSSAFVVDACGELAPRGVVGELYVGGAGVARGYANRSELSAERFVTRPSIAEGLLYRTGDLARWRADGELEFLGRADQQVKVRGFRIELGEVESILREHALVTDVVVSVWQPSEEAPKRLVAYVVAEGDVRASVLRSYLERRLPAYMVPASYVFLTSLPLTAHQKVDRRALPAPGDGSESFVAPATPQEELLCSIWARLLGLEWLGTRDDLLERGGDSLMALQAAMQARKHGFHVDPNVFVQQRSVQASAPRMVPCERSSEALGPADTGAGRLPLSALQKSMLVHSLVSGAPDLYLQHIELPLSGTVQPDAMREALAALVSRHPGLRASFVLDDDGACRQRIHDMVELSFSFADLSGLTPDARRRHYESLREQDRTQGFDLATPDLVLFRLFKESDQTYRLAIVHHHIVFDGWSLSILLEELHALYDEQLHGRRTTRAAAPSIQSYANWCEERDSGAAEAFWRAELAGMDDVTSFGPLARTPDPGTSFAHRECHARLASADVTALSAFAAENGFTVSTLFQGAWAYLLSQLSGSNDVTFGMTVSGRDASCERADERVGLLINTLPVRCRLSPESTVGAWLREQQDRLGAVREHCTVTQDQLRAWSDIQPSSGPFRLFDSVLVYENFPRPTTVSGESRFGFGELSFSVPVHAPAVIAVIPTADTIRLQCSYDGRLFDEDDARQLLQSLGHVVSELVRCGSEGQLKQVRLATAEEMALLTAWNATEAPVSGDDVCRLFVRRAKEQPDAIAVEAGDRRLTYRELDLAAEALALRLRASGVRAGDRVALYLERSPEHVIAMLSVLRVGACFVPLGTAEPQKRLDLKLVDARPALVLTSRALSGGVSHASAPCMCVDGAASGASAALAADSGSARGDAPAYVIYTSGTTGVPKGVVVSRASLTNYAVAAAANFALTRRDRALQFASVTFDACLEEIFPTLLAGATLVLRDEASISDFERFSDFCLANRITVVNLPTAFWEGWTREVNALPAGVRLVVIGGDAASTATLARWRTLASPELRLLNTYGPTEGTIVATALDVSSWDPADFRGVTIPIGTPVANVQAWVCGPWGRPQPPGVAGELVLAGAGVALGYLGDEARTREKFLPAAPSNPFAGRGYRTGDRARWTRDGDLEFLGRFDDQVKVNGFRVEVQEVEAALSEHPNVKLAAVKAFRRGTAVTLIGYVTERFVLNPAEYHAHLRARLPEYMCPSEIVALANMPLTSSGKVDKRALAMPEAKARAVAAGRVGNDLEEIVLSVLSDALGVEANLDADFFAMGGTSILATIVASRLRKLVAIDVPVRWLLQHPTARGLAGAMSRGSDESLTHSCVVPLKSSGDQTPVFFVPGVFGSVGYLSTLARSLAEDRPLYAFQAPGVDGRRPLASVEELVEHYWQAMRSVRPHGSYVLAGHSFGAAVAHALAGRIIASGAAVEHLFLVDGLAPTQDAPDEECSRAQLLSEFSAMFSDFLGAGAAVTAAELDGLSEDRGFELVHKQLGEVIDRELLERFFSVFDASMRAPAPAQSKPLAVRATLLKATEHGASGVLDDPRYGWDAHLASGLEVVMISGGHYSMFMAPAVAELSRVIERRIQSGGDE